ncbi:diguanylate cyclase [Methylomonas sp. EFPC1]|uniref:diguanylate cyclase domain-containing protein n=1 Tax=Methylomonas sp. EFPC1 TaxID=2812647 RepID=UPI0019689321|nr:diguanylate cyclase [Methylomonas sp. EFPC1]QSB00266.1 diguanylate cyclase [Methylomonas sp. EFPC1]
MNTASAKANSCLLVMDHDPANRMANKHSLAGFQDHDSALCEGEPSHHGLKLAEDRQPERVRWDRQLRDMQDAAYLANQSETLKQPNVSTLMQVESDDEASLAGESHDCTNVADAESPTEICREQREQQMFVEKTEALEQLREAEAKYRTLVDQMPVITYIASLETPVKLLYVSPQISQLGFPEQDWLDDPQGLLKRVHPDDLAVTAEAYAYTYEHRAPLRCEYRLRKHDGHHRWFLDEANVVRNEAGESLFLQGVLVDITKDKETEQELSYYRQRLEELVFKRTEQLEKQCVILKSANASLDATLVKLKHANTEARDSERRFRLLLDSAGEGIVGLDANGRCSFVNRAALQMLGYAEKDALGHDIVSMMADDLTLALEALGSPELARDIVAQRSIAKFKRKDGRSFPVEYSFYPVGLDGFVDSVVLVFWDMSASDAKIQSLAYQASHDPLTGLVNRTAFEQRLTRVLASARPGYFQHALCYLDLDHFKQVNDTCGHAAGDELLRRISTVLSSKLRQRDTLARLGGDEFALLLEHTTLDQARNIAHELCDSLRNFKFNWGDTEFTVSASIGVAAVTCTVRDVDEFLNNADSACYRAKEKGRNQVHVFLPDNVERLDQFGQWKA